MARKKCFSTDETDHRDDYHVILYVIGSYFVAINFIDWMLLIMPIYVEGAGVVLVKCACVNNALSLFDEY